MIIIHYRAYSTKGTGKPITFVNSDFKVDRSYDDITHEIEVTKSLRILLRKQGINSHIAVETT